MAGAVALAGRAALLTGAGLVRLAVPDPILETVAGYSPEPTTIPCPTDQAGRFSLDALEPLLTHAEHCTALFLGPGLGRSGELDRLVPQFLQKIAKPIVVDADAINALSVTNHHGEETADGRRQTAAEGRGGVGAKDFVPLPFAALFSTRKEHRCILTPHVGEFARLRGEPTPSEGDQEKRQAAALAFARRFGIVLVLKGHETIITDGERLVLNTTGNPGMATGGSGDVLTGMMTGLIAQNCLPIFDTVRLAVHLHGLAGDIAAERLGEESVTATAILEAIPGAFAQIRVS